MLCGWLIQKRRWYVKHVTGIQYITLGPRRLFRDNLQLWLVNVLERGNEAILINARRDASLIIAS